MAYATGPKVPPAKLPGLTCHHKPLGCCRHNLAVMVPVWLGGPCTPECGRRENQCMTATPGGGTGVRVDCPEKTWPSGLPDGALPVQPGFEPIHEHGLNTLCQ